MSASDDRLTRTEYYGPLDALTDAERVQLDLIHALDGQVVVPVAEIEFLARRALRLVRGCIDLEVNRP